MNALYHWVGLVVVWAVVGSIGTLAVWWAWHHRPRNAFTRRVGNAWVWLTVFVFGRRWFVPLEGARMLLTAYNRKRPRSLAGWERDIIAVNMRHSHRLGWRPLNR